MEQAARLSADGLSWKSFLKAGWSQWPLISPVRPRRAETRRSAYPA